MVIPSIEPASVHLWDTGVEAWVEHACRLADGQFPEKWVTIFGDIPYRRPAPGP